jgi:hypothetical protein
MLLDDLEGIIEDICLDPTADRGLGAVVEEIKPFPLKRLVTRVVLIGARVGCHGNGHQE